MTPTIPQCRGITMCRSVLFMNKVILQHGSVDYGDLLRSPSAAPENLDLHRCRIWYFMI